MNEKIKVNNLTTKYLICVCVISIFILLTKDFSIIFANESISFKDVTENQWFYNKLMYATSYQIINGFSDGTFRPNETLTKEQYIKMLVMIVDSSFDPVKYKNDSWFDPYLRRAKEIKIVREDLKDNDYYKKAITREEVAIYTYNAYNVYKSEEVINTAEMNVIPLIE